MGVVRMLPWVGSPGPELGPEVAPCHEEVCITCSDQAVAVRIRELLPGALALVDTVAGPERISVALVDAEIGDLVLVHAQEAIALLEEEGPDDAA